MKYIVLGFLKKDKVSAILDVSEQTYRDLSHVEVVYSKGTKYYLCRTFTTSAWVAKSPLGPPSAEDEGVAGITQLDDVAEVYEFDSLYDVSAFRATSPLDIQKLYWKLDDLALVYIRRCLAPYSDLLHTATFHLLPRPMVIASFVSGMEFLGSISLSLRGEVDTIIRGGTALNSIVNHLQSAHEKISCKEVKMLNE